MEIVEVPYLVSANGEHIRVGQTVIGTKYNQHAITSSTTVCEVVDTELETSADTDTSTPRLTLKVLGACKTKHVERIKTHIGREFVVDDPTNFIHYKEHCPIFTNVSDANIKNKFKRFDLITGNNKNSYSFTHPSSICIVERVLDEYKVIVRRIGRIQPGGFIQVGTKKEFCQINDVESRQFDPYCIVLPPDYNGNVVSKNTNLVSNGGRDNHLPIGVVFKVLYDLGRSLMVVAIEYLPIHFAFGLSFDNMSAPIFLVDKELCRDYDKKIHYEYYIENVAVQLIDES